MEPLGILFALAVGITLFILVLIFVVVPLFRGLASVIGWSFRGIGWLFAHLFEFIGGMISDVLRLIGAIIATIILLPLAPLNIVLGRWSAAGHFAESIKRELKVAGACVYRVALHRPLKLFWLHGILEGIEQRVPEAMAAAPGADKPSRRAGQFDGYTITGSLKGGGSGAKLYIAQPDDRLRKKGMPDRVVIKSFALTDGSSLPQIVRESRALEAAKQLGLVLEHGMDNHRFYYIMPYHPGEHLGIVTRQLHAEAGGRGLGPRQLRDILRYEQDLVGTLTTYHSGGLWHKDLKPENVIVKSGHAHLVDLGLVTPLRSAMTLTTHGTEYFRDPEMVRQALRGVKVHQVDGAKFDIYAAGAVLYFMLENTFPAHGGLSRFSRKSPESLRWIVRRAMTDYDKRYETADAMFADLAVAAAASDPYDVKPADLPSMNGGAAPTMADADVKAEADEPAVEQVAFAGSPRPPSGDQEAAADEDVLFKGFGLQVEAGKEGVKVASLSGKTYFDSSKAGRATVRPKLRVTNWWTGAYTVDDPDVAPAAAHAAAAPRSADAQAFRTESRDFHREADEIASRFQAGAITARRAAREQIQAARQRAADIRRRTKENRQHRRERQNSALATNSQPSAFLGFVTMVLVVVGGYFGVQWFRHGVASNRNSTVIVGGAPDAPYAKVAAARWPALLVLDVDDPADPRWSSTVKGILDRRANTSYEVFAGAPEENARWRMLLADWQRNPDGPADMALEDLLEEQDLYAIIYAKPGKSGRVDDTVIYSEREGAKARRRVLTPAPGIDQPLVLINDHPTKVDPLVAAKIQRILDIHRERGWQVITPDEALEASILAGLRGRHDPETISLSTFMQYTLAESDLGGVLWIGARPGGADPIERLSVRRLLVDNESLMGEDWEIEATEFPPLPELPPLPEIPTASSDDGC